MEEKNYKKYIVFLLPVVILLVVLLFTKSSFANPELIQEISLYSEEKDYLNNETNSWELKKKAKWINDHEAEIEINVKSKPFDSSAHDYIFMIDLTGENNLYLAEDFYRDYLYSEFTIPTNNITIIGYSENPSYLFLEKETNPESINNAFNSISDDNHLTTGDNVDYYDALLNLEDVLSYYDAQEDETIKVIFIGKPYDGLTPNNQEEEFDYIKETFTNVEFYFANTGDITTSGFLNKKVDFIGNDIELLTAANVIDEFVVTDYINTKYFEYEEVIENSYKFLAYVNCIPENGGIKSPKKVGAKGGTSSNNCYCGGPLAPVRGTRSTKSLDATPSDPCGIMTLEYQMNTLEIDEETGKITWDLSNAIYSTNATLRLKVKLKDEYRDSDEIFTTNTSTQVESSLDEIEEDISTNESPELKLFYKVTYFGNMPEGCYFEPVVETHKMGSVVSTLSAPSCEGYVFKGWVGTYIDSLPDIDPNGYYESGAYNFISYEEWYDYMLHDYEYEVEYLGESFIMPQSDVEAKALWGKVGIDKHFEGDELGSYALYSITQKSLVNATELDDPVLLHRSTVTQVTLNTLDAYVDYEVMAVNLSDANYRLEVSSVNTGSTNAEFEILEEPIGVSANSSTKFTLRLKYKDGLTELPENKNYSLQLFFRFVRDGAMFKPGADVNYRMRQLVNPNTEYYDGDTTITSIRRYEGIPDSSLLVSQNEVSINGSDFMDPIYMWYDEENTTIYWYSPARHVYFNYDANRFYADLQSLDSLDLSDLSSEYTTEMNHMFANVGVNSGSFTLDLGDKFDTSNVTDMSYMFYWTGSNNNYFTLDLGDNFDTSNVINMGNMFEGTGRWGSNFTIDLGDKFDTSKVSNMYGLFSNMGGGSTILTLDLGDKFDTSNVTNMRSMFNATGYRSTLFTLDLKDKFDTSKVTDMNSMFSSAGQGNPSFTLDLGDKFDTSNVTDMGGMFSSVGLNSVIFTLDLGDKFDTSNVTNMNSMFYNVGHSNPNFTELDLGAKFNTSKVYNMTYMFNSCINLVTIYVPDTFDASKAINSYSVFTYDNKLVGEHGTTYSGANVGTSYAHIDEGPSNPGYFTSRIEIDVSMFLPGKVVNSRMKRFISSGASQSTEDRTITRITRYTSIPDSSVLVDSNKVSTVFSEYPIYMWYDSNSTTIYWYCEDETPYYNYDASSFYSNLFSLNEITNLADIATSYTTNMQYMFNNTGYNSTTLTIDLGSNFDTSNVTNMSNMFNGTGFKSTLYTLDLKDKFDTSNVTDMASMFYLNGFSSSSFTLRLGNKFDTSNVTNMYRMFGYTGSGSNIFTLNLGDKFDTSNVTNMNSMFSNTGSKNPSFTLDLGDKFYTTNVKFMAGMFSMTGNNSTIFTLDLGDNFDTSKVTDMNGMFMGLGEKSTVFTLDLGDKFDTSKVTNMTSMFSSLGKGNSNFTVLDLGPNFDTSNVTSMYQMFSSSNTLTTIKVPNLFTTNKVTNSDEMFYGCTSLVGGAGTTYSGGKIDKTYAHIDGGTSNPGYFTARS